MERLTERYGIAPDGESDVWVKQHDYISAARKLCDYEDLEEQGLLARLPCKVGDSVFIIVGKDVSKQGIRKIEISDNGIIFKTNRQKRIFNVSEFEKSVFLTREEAVNKLEEMKK
nr:MAG TPA: ribosomal protein [Caudoviricetes sp.]